MCEEERKRERERKNRGGGLVVGSLMLHILDGIGKAHVHVEFSPGRQEMVINTVGRRGAKVTAGLAPSTRYLLVYPLVPSITKLAREMMSMNLEPH